MEDWWKDPTPWFRLGCAHTNRVSPIWNQRGASVFTGGRGSQGRLVTIRDSVEVGRGGGGEAGILAWLHLESWPSCPPVTHALKGTTFLPGGQPGVFKLGLDSTGVPGDSCSCGPPPLFPPTALAPSRSHLIRSALFTDKRMSVGPTVQEEMETGKCHTASRSHSRRSASPCGFVLLCPGAPRYEAIKEGATHTVDLGVPFPGPCGAFRSSVPFPPPLIQTHLRRPRLWPRPCGPARRRAARVL